MIKDPFGNGVAGVSVQILKTQFKTVTDRDGRYHLIMFQDIHDPTLEGRLHPRTGWT